VTKEWQSAEIPAASCYGNASVVAKIGAINRIILVNAKPKKI